MSKFKLLLIVLVAGFIAYTIFSDPNKRDKFFDVVENSTGIKVDKSTKKALTKTADKLGDSTEQLWTRLSDSIQDKKFQQAMEKWGAAAMEKLDSKKLSRLMKDLKKEAARGTGNYDRIFKKYLDA
ncbi:MAG: hypothetical protein B0D92_04270 [Spirochaeta sp. LUC14_002_19_P3]|nr:MAG: hypothetical protein B0D92_04270 [Spirochaeta sp. LUC14_002_19_P3]